uniref:hypothetical protein n=1 Tax=Ensifer adhaerens TaxID=106592 RepID=UPI003F49453B
MSDVFETQNIGVQSPGAGSNAGLGTWVLAEELGADGFLTRFKCYSTVAAPIQVGVFSRVGNENELLRSVDVPLAIGWNSIPICLPGERGNLAGATVSSVGTLKFASGTNHWFYFGTLSEGKFTDDTLSTGNELQMGFEVTSIVTGHTVHLGKVDRCVMYGPSYQNAHYNIKGKFPFGKVSPFSDFNFETFSYSGHSLFEMLRDRLRVDTVTGYAPIHPKDMGTTYSFIAEGENSFKDGISFSTYQETMRQTVETVKSFGSIPVLCSEWKPVYNASAHAVHKAVAEEMGVYHVNMIPHTLRNFNGTVYGDFTQDPGNIQHPGTRTSSILADAYEKFIETLPRPANSIKIFRKRDSITVSNLDADLMFRDAYERAERFKEISLNQVHLTEATEKYFDELTTSAGLYSQNSITKSEYLLLQNGGSIALGTHALLDVVINATQKNVDRFELTLSDPAVSVYIKNARAGGTYPADGVSVCRWTALTGSNGVFKLNRADLPGKMHFDKLTFLLVKAGGITIKQPVIRWWGEPGKPAYPVKAQPAATGVELLPVTKFTSIGTDKTTGWAVSPTITPSDDTTYQLPYDITHFVTVDATKKVVQTLDYAVDNFNDIEVEIRVSARYFKEKFASSGVYPSGSPINQDTFDYTKVFVELIDPTGAFTFTQWKKLGPWWNDLVFRAILPMRVSPLDIRVSAKDEIQLAEVSVKRV